MSVDSKNVKAGKASNKTTNFHWQQICLEQYTSTDSKAQEKLKQAAYLNLSKNI